MPEVRPQIILLSDELKALQDDGRSSGSGFAKLLDLRDGVPEVVHLSLAGDARVEWPFIRLEWRLNGAEAASDGSKPKATLWLDATSAAPSARCLLELDESRAFDCPVAIVQTGGQAFTRNAPIVETDALATASVLCVGVGSGGSAVVDQLARSGVGRFVLWDMDRLESHNIGRHLCTLRDLGRRKVLAVRDHILAVNPQARVECIDKDVSKAANVGGELDAVVSGVDCVIVGTDNNASRFAINSAAWRQRKVALYGRAFTRAAGGDAIQVIPPLTPCYACHLAGRVVEEEIASAHDAERVAYADKPVPIEPGLSIDIQPIANMIARLCVLRLLERTGSSLRTFAGEMNAPLYLWANRREYQFAAWQPMERSYSRMAVLRWYAIGVRSDPECPTCGKGDPC